MSWPCQIARRPRFNCRHSVRSGAAGPLSSDRAFILAALPIRIGPAHPRPIRRENFVNIPWLHPRTLVRLGIRDEGTRSDRIHTVRTRRQRRGSGSLIRFCRPPTDPVAHLRKLVPGFQSRRPIPQAQTRHRRPKQYCLVGTLRNSARPRRANGRGTGSKGFVVQQTGSGVGKLRGKRRK